MMKSSIAEWLLSQVLPPDRAVSAVGDWMEDVDKRGNIWFWSCVFRTAVSRVWTDFVDSPGFMVSLALRSCLLAWLVYAIGTIVLIPASYLFVVLFQILPSPHTRIAFWFLSELAGWTSVTAFGVLTGRWTARRAMNGKMAACIACCIAHPMLS